MRYNLQESSNLTGEGKLEEGSEILIVDLISSFSQF